MAEHSSALGCSESARKRGAYWGRERDDKSLGWGGDIQEGFNFPHPWETHVHVHHVHAHSEGITVLCIHLETTHTHTHAAAAVSALEPRGIPREETLNTHRHTRAHTVHTIDTHTDFDEHADFDGSPL